jgi:hypothetical protein
MEKGQQCPHRPRCAPVAEKEHRLGDVNFFLNPYYSLDLAPANLLLFSNRNKAHTQETFKAFFFEWPMFHGHGKDHWAKAGAK